MPLDRSLQTERGQSPLIARWEAGGTSRFPRPPPLVRFADRPLRGRRRRVGALIQAPGVDQQPDGEDSGDRYYDEVGDERDGEEVLTEPSSEAVLGRPRRRALPVSRARVRGCRLETPPADG